MLPQQMTMDGRLEDVAPVHETQRLFTPPKTMPGQLGWTDARCKAAKAARAAGGHPYAMFEPGPHAPAQEPQRVILCGPLMARSLGEAGWRMIGQHRGMFQMERPR